MKINLRDFGKRLHLVRNSRNLTQAKLAELIDLTDKQISNIENGTVPPSFNTLSNLCEVLEVNPIFFFLTGSDEEIPSLYSKLSEENRNNVNSIIKALYQNQEFSIFENS